MSGSLPSYLSALNPEQREAVLHWGSPLLILAGAGSGKTRVITTKIAYLIKERGMDPKSILAVTFTNKAAGEMAERARAIEPRAAEVMIRTFHSLGAWFLRRNSAGYNSKFVIYDEDDSLSLLGTIMEDASRLVLKQTAQQISRAKDYFLSPDDPELDLINYLPDFRKIYARYEERMAGIGNVDFGDLIKKPVETLRAYPEIARRFHERFKVILVDEYQDSNVAQFALLKELAGPETYICVVGDDDQSIYRFRGAEVKNILEFPDRFPGTCIVRLERNYRSFAPILALASSVVNHNTGRLGKTLRAERQGGITPLLAFLPDQDSEVAFCANLIENSGAAFSDWALLYRTNAQSLGFETGLLRRRIPYRVVGSLKFYEREEVKDALALLSFLVNPRDEVAFRRVVNKPARGLGPATVDRIVIAAAEQGASGEDAASGASTTSGEGMASGANTTSGETEPANKSPVPGGDLVLAAKKIAPSLNPKAREGLGNFLSALERARLAIGLQAGAGPYAADSAEFEDGAATPGLAAPNATAPGMAAPNAAAPNATAPGMATPGAAASGGQILPGAVLAGQDMAEPGTLDFGPLPQGRKSPGETPLRYGDGLSLCVVLLVQEAGIAEYHQLRDEAQGNQRVANLQELANAASLYEASEKGLLEFLEHIELDRSIEEDGDTGDAVTLITLHNTKGLEFRRVIMTGLEQGVFPREDKKGDDLEEERRLFYVGATRAMDALYLTSCKERRLYGRSQPLSPSAFLHEIDRSCLSVKGQAPPPFVSSSDESRIPGYTYGGADYGAYDRPHNSGRNLRQPVKSADGRWQLGDRLFHDDYGYGGVTGIRQSEDGSVVEVRFETGRELHFISEYQSSRFMKTGDD
ncbi:MAG: ATP-dependent helicase [Spirochaetaceae bacterium]|jgi:DNA helicase-2/ATP-dependent DNA helicase PcrA|nr:ATP-dependent helicase [Spirochaetaceae bacterium]